MNDIRYFPLFSGIGAPDSAIKDVIKELNVVVETIGFSEIEPNAIKSYCAAHNLDEKLNYGDVSAIQNDNLPLSDLVIWGSPCQDFSEVGSKKGSVWTCNDCDYEYNPITVDYEHRYNCPHCGSKNIKKTRSSLIVEGLRVVHETKPKFSIYENVPGILNDKNKATFDCFINELENMGYKNYYQILKGSDYEDPQGRRRVFVVSIREDIDKGFAFPKPVELKVWFRDLLEDKVDDKYYNILKDFFIKNSFDMEAKGNGFRFEPFLKQNAKIAKTITTKSGCRMDDNFIVENLNLDIEKFKFDRKNKYIECKPEEINPNDYIIRKLTSRENWRVMGFKDEEYEKALATGISESQLNQQAGNSICVHVLYHLIKALFEQYIVNK
jgi:DNA-cytosine methyltransferase